jgi:hypothetical protein
VDTEFREMSAEFRKMSYFCEISLLRNFFPTSHTGTGTLCCSIEHIKLKLLLFSKLFTNFAVGNFGELSYPPMRMFH